jgi:hypothetical protein
MFLFMDDGVPETALELAQTILAFAKSQTSNRELIGDALKIAHEANLADRFSGSLSERR